MCGPPATCGRSVTATTAALTGRWRCTGTAAPGPAHRFPAPACCARSPAAVPPLPAAPGVGPAPSPPPPTPPAQAPVPVTFTDQAAAAGISGSPDWSFSAAVADFTGDGWPDLFVSHHWHPANLWLN